MDWETIRAEFPALAHWTYLNTATFGQLPRCATEAVARHWAHRDETACGDFLTWFDDADQLRGSLARLIHATGDDIAFVPSAAHALSQIVVGLGLYDAPEGANVVTLQGDFPNQLYLPKLREVPWRNFYEAIDADTKLIAISEVNYATGFRPPLAEISRFVDAIPGFRRPVLYVDGTQSVGALQFDVRATPVDVFAVHGYKWLISPNGVGFFYIAPHLRARIRPCVVGWRSHRDWRNVDHLHHGTPVFKESAEKYEGGFLPVALLYAMEASVNLILSIGPVEIEHRVMDLAADLRARLERLGAELETENVNSQIVTASFSGADASALAKELARRRVLVSARHGRLRVSPHFYNNETDLARFESELKSIL
ncbi:MAG: aminotransferase class V-fold PLP-dependent enzyme [Bryobacterales bacterium]|nr:aminotransferase class V-fold PLP-dependent enzyme [Bryobacterales bacterium]